MQSQPQPAQAAGEPQHNAIADAERELAFKSRFASNLVSGNDNASRPATISGDSVNTPSHSNSDNDIAHPSDLRAQIAASEKKRASEVNVNAAHGKPYVLFEGTTIDTALDIRYRK
jgi:hypothetical protein